ncbi:rab-GTPase-TBC domain-containing protein [Chytridium lagenaria]|nr:rab-GTPase-TBC domain-containing protein [Chytridium lagenaria]
MIARVLNAFVWKAKDQPPSRLINLKFSYVQGMNVMLAPFLYVMPELDAYFTFTSFIHHTCPLYVQPALEGVHCGIKLLEKCMKIADPALYRSLRSKNLHPITYAFPSVMTFCACTQPLTEVLKLWDFLLSYGVHLNILCIIAQLILIREELINSPSPIKLLRTLPDLHAKPIVTMALSLIPLLPDSLYDMLVRHPFDPMINDFILPETLEVEEEELMSSLYVQQGGVAERNLMDWPVFGAE